MRAKYIVSSLLLLMLLISNVNAQNLKLTSWGDDWDDYKMFNWSSDNHPFMEFTYGVAEPKHKLYGADFEKPGLAEIKLGYYFQDTYTENYLLYFDSKYFYTSNFSKDIASDKDENKNYLDVWNFGFGTTEGYGYRVSRGFSILPYHGRTFGLTKITADNIESLAENDMEIMKRYNDEFRFSVSGEGGVKFELASMFSLNAGYEFQTVHPRLQFWKFLGSVIIEESGNSLLDLFIDEVADSTPAAAPLVNFVLKNAYSYAIYSLRKEDVNWPFSTETPMTFEQFKFGISFNF